MKDYYGFDQQPFYYGQSAGVIAPTALGVADVMSHDWRGVTVFLEVCFSAVNMAIPEAFLKRGARVVIGSVGPAYGRVSPTIPLPGFDGEADRLLQLLVLPVTD